MQCEYFFCFKQKTAYEMRISDWSSNVCSSDLPKPEKAATRAVDGIVMYPSLSQKKQFRELLVETQSESRFQKARDGELPHFVVKAASTDKFVEVVGEAAKERFQTEYAEHLSNNGGQAPEPYADTNKIGRAQV